jgi:hypothetical protein
VTVETAVGVSLGRDGFGVGVSVGGGGGVAVRTKGGVGDWGEQEVRRKVRSKKEEVRRKMRSWWWGGMGGILTEVGR